MIDRNPFENVIYPKSTVEVKEKEVKFYTTDQIKLIMDTLENDVKQSASKNIGKQYRTLLTLSLYRTLAFSGMRVSEACALTWSDIDFLNNTITINKTLSKVKKGYVVSSPKTKSSNRTLAMDHKTMRILKQWQLKQKELLFANGITKVDHVFTQWHGKMLNSHTVLFNSKTIAKRCNLPVIGTHAYRHSHASMLFESNVSMKEAQVRLGHSNIEMTMNIYTHVTSEAQTKTIEKLTKFANF
ncbi:site-specific integrase [Enterococcus bulliens]